MLSQQGFRQEKITRRRQISSKNVPKLCFPPKSRVSTFQQLPIGAWKHWINIDKQNKKKGFYFTLQCLKLHFLLSFFPPLKNQWLKATRLLTNQSSYNNYNSRFDQEPIKNDRLFNIINAYFQTIKEFKLIRFLLLQETFTRAFAQSFSAVKKKK